MDKTIIGIYGSGGEGKSDTIKKVAQMLLAHYPSAKSIHSPDDFDKVKDINMVIQLGAIKIGIESQGDPNSRMIYDKTVEKLAKDEGCDIVLCASRTGGETVKTVNDVAKAYGYNTIWLSSFYSYTLKQRVLNQMAAENIVRLIEALITERIYKK